MSKTKSCPKSYKQNIIVEFSKRKKYILSKRKASWKKLFYKYTHRTSKDIEINLTTLMPEECNISKKNVSEDKTLKDTEFESRKKVKTNITHRKDINGAFHTRMIWCISSTGLLVALINGASNKTISVKKQYVQDTNLVSNTELKGSTKFVTQTQAFDFDSD